MRNRHMDKSIRVGLRVMGAFIVAGTSLVAANSLATTVGGVSGTREATGDTCLGPTGGGALSRVSNSCGGTSKVWIMDPPVTSGSHTITVRVFDNGANGNPLVSC